MSSRNLRSQVLARRLSWRTEPEPDPEPEAVPKLNPGSLWVVVPCKGRLTFLQETVPCVIEQAGVYYCLVDYSCPDRAGDWFEATFPEAVRGGRAVTERVHGQALFHKSCAHNAGARRAIREGAEYLCFLDADTIVRPGFVEFVRQNMAADRFLISARRPDGRDVPSLAGLLVVSAAAFEAIGGFDEGFSGWGAEDIELRLRLFLLGGIDYGDVPLDLLQPMPHDDRLRTSFYEQKDVRISHRENLRRVREKITIEWAGRCVRELSDAARLCCGPPQRVGINPSRGPAPPHAAIQRASPRVTHSRRLLTRFARVRVR
jgi:hypothetical protein